MSAHMDADREQRTEMCQQERKQWISAESCWLPLELGGPQRAQLLKGSILPNRDNY